MFTKLETGTFIVICLLVYWSVKGLGSAVLAIDLCPTGN